MKNRKVKGHAKTKKVTMKELKQISGGKNVVTCAGQSGIAEERLNKQSTKIE